MSYTKLCGQSGISNPSKYATVSVLIGEGPCLARDCNTDFLLVANIQTLLKLNIAIINNNDCILLKFETRD